ncbi:MAG: cobalamin-binding protein [Candidatus Lokiarchaeota archaeon]|nr:cobalamin-binding protein [Candidatus Lokiarchaeota archaeon]
MEDISKALGELEEDKVLELVQKAIDEGKDPINILEALQKGMDIIGKLYEKNEYFLSDLIFSAEIFENANNKLLPLLEKSQGDRLGKIILGTVKGDVHDIGKNIVGALLRCAGFEVIDIGVDQPVKNFVAAVKKNNPDLVGLSGLLTIAFDSMKETISELRKLGDLKIIIGGGIIDQNWCKQVGADGFTTDAMDGIMKIKKLLDVT